MRCPTCKREFAGEANRFRPFCSQRCRMIDLGRWLDGDYAVAGEPASAEEMAGALAKSEPPARRSR